ncbi:MAG: YaiI/YqxD family protein [Notoacmeibacter sp.]
MITIYVDADACPVKDEVLKVAERHALPVVFVANSGLKPSRDPVVKMVVVSGKFDAADDWIVENSKPNDIGITADMPLAAQLVAKGVHTLSHAGRAFTEANIGMALGMRNLNQELREAQVIKGHNAAFSPRDRSNFLQALESAVVKAKRSSTSA